MSNVIQSFEDLIDLANERIGGAAILCSDDFFAGMDNLVKAKEAIWDENAYTDRGKWMDGWESKRSHRENDEGAANEDFCIVRLGAPGIIKGVVVDTAFFRGNYPSHCALEGTAVDGYPTPLQIQDHAKWVPLLPKSPLQGNAKNPFTIDSPLRFTHVRLRIFPDGGVARLRVYGEPLPDWALHGGLDGEIDLASAELGAVVVSCSDMFFGSRHNLLFPGFSSGMHDGWETRRARRAGYDWAVIKLAAKGHCSRIVVDTSHFKGNCPESFALDGGNLQPGTSPGTGVGGGSPGTGTGVGGGPGTGVGAGEWTEIFARHKLLPHTRHVFHQGFSSSAAFSHVRLRIYPDGGLARFRMFGRVADDDKPVQRVRRLNGMPEGEAASVLHSLCGSIVWARHVVDARPFADPAALERAIDEAFDAMTERDWLEAFAAHPRIGAKVAVGTRESREQAGALSATDHVRARLAELNEEYFNRFGFIYIVFASGKNASEMLEILERRLENDRATEIRNAAAEQKKITALRLQKVQ